MGDRFTVEFHRELFQFLDRFVASNHTHRLHEQIFSRRNFVPGRRARWMRQWNEIVCVAISPHRKTPANYFFQFHEWNEPRDCQSSDGNDKARAQNFEFIVHPRGTVLNFLGIWDAIGAARHFTGKTAANGGEINRRANLLFRKSAKSTEPIEERPTRGVCEGALQHGFAHSRCLADEHNATNDCASRNRWRKHARTTAALDESRDVLFETLLPSRNFAHWQSSQSGRLRSIVLPAKKRKYQAQDDTDDDAGNDREIKYGISALDPNVPGQTA
jgi:hypothetical protein